MKNHLWTGMHIQVQDFGDCNFPGINGGTSEVTHLYHGSKAMWQAQYNTLSPISLEIRGSRQSSIGGFWLGLLRYRSAWGLVYQSTLCGNVSNRVCLSKMCSCPWRLWISERAPINFNCFLWYGNLCEGIRVQYPPQFPMFIHVLQFIYALVI